MNVAAPKLPEIGYGRSTTLDLCLSGT